MEQFPRFSRGHLGKLQVADLNRILEIVEGASSLTESTGGASAQFSRVATLRVGESLGAVGKWNLYAWSSGSATGISADPFRLTLTHAYDSRAPVPLASSGVLSDGQQVNALRSECDPSLGADPTSRAVYRTAWIAQTGIVGATGVYPVAGGNRISTFITTGGIVINNTWTYADQVPASSVVTVLPSPVPFVLAALWFPTNTWYTHVACPLRVECAP